MATMVTRTHLNVMFKHTLTVLLLYISSPEPTVMEWGSSLYTNIKAPYNCGKILPSTSCKFPK